MNAIKPVGGRGHTAPYTTSIVRVPDPIRPEVDRMIEAYRIAVLSELSDEDLSSGINPKSSDVQILSKQNVIELARQVLKRRKSAKLSLEKLLQLIYDDSTINL